MTNVINAWKNFWYRRKAKKANRRSKWDAVVDFLEDLTFD